MEQRTAEQAREQTLALAKALGLSDEATELLVKSALAGLVNDEKNQQVRARTDMDTDLKASLPDFIKVIADKYGVDLKDRKITIYFPLEGEAVVAHISKEDEKPGKRNGNGKKGSSNGNAFKSHGKVVDDETGKEFKSLHAFCVASGIKYEGERTAFVALDTCKDVKSQVPLPFHYTTNTVEVDGKPVIHLTKLTRDGKPFTPPTPAPKARKPKARKPSLEPAGDTAVALTDGSSPEPEPELTIAQ